MSDPSCEFRHGQPGWVFVLVGAICIGLGLAAGLSGNIAPKGMPENIDPARAWILAGIMLLLGLGLIGFGVRRMRG